jgi:hypothetical protein
VETLPSKISQLVFKQNEKLLEALVDERMKQVHMKPIDKLIETLNFKQDVTLKELKTHICKQEFIQIF